MKRVLVLMLAVVAMAACKKKDANPWDSFDRYAKVQIKPMEATAKSSNPQHLSPLEVVKQTTLYGAYNDNTPVDGGWDGKPGIGGWREDLRDTTSNPPMLLREANDIIHLKDENVWGLQRGWMDAYDIVLCRGEGIYDADTIAYIPNAQMFAARDAIYAAWDANDEAAIYEIFRDAFKFVPITGPEYKELKRQGLQ